jgi:hypothetical protein
MALKRVSPSLEQKLAAKPNQGGDLSPPRFGFHPIGPISACTLKSVAG